MFYDVCIFHRAVDEVPRADLGATEQEVAEPLLVLVPVQSSAGTRTCSELFRCAEMERT